MKKICLSLAAVVAFAMLGVSQLKAQCPVGVSGPCLFYNGDFNGVNGLANEGSDSLGPGVQVQTFDNFTPNSNWTVSGVFSNDLIGGGFVGNGTAEWEIRSGVSEGNGGNLIAGEIISPATYTSNGQDGFGFTGTTVDVSGLNVGLSGGTEYWLTVVPLDDGLGRSFLSTTSFANAIYTHGSHKNDNAFFDSAFFGAHFLNAADQIGHPANFSFGLGGIPSGGGPVPEPSSLLLLGSGLLGLGGVIRRRLLGRRGGS